MAISVSLSMTSPNIIAEAVTNFVITVANSGASPIVLNSLQPVVTPSMVSSTSPIGGLEPETPMSIPNAGSLTFPMSIVFHAPQMPGATGMASAQYQVTIIAYTADGSVTSSIPLQVIPQTEAYPQQGALPALGQLVFDTPLSSALWFFFA
jgi:hypothetical protein